MLRVVNDYAAAAASREIGPGAVKSIVYRNYAPLYVGEKMTVCVRPAKSVNEDDEEEWDVWVQGPEGGMAVRGSVVVMR